MTINKILPLACVCLFLVACNKQTDDIKLDNVKQQAEKIATQKHDNTKEHSHEAVILENAYVRASGPGQKVSSAFFTLKNSSNEDVIVKEITSSVAKVTEFHTMEVSDNKMIMRKMEKVTVPANSELVLSPGADHVMLIGLKKGLKVGDAVTLSLTMSNGQTITLDTNVKPMPTSIVDKQQSNHSSGHDHEHMEHHHEMSQEHASH